MFSLRSKSRVLFRSIVPSQLSALSLRQALDLIDMYLENACKTVDHDIALVLCHDAEVALSQAKSATKKGSKDAADPSLREGIASAYIDLEKLLESQGYQTGDLTRRWKKWGVSKGSPQCTCDETYQRTILTRCVCNLQWGVDRTVRLWDVGSGQCRAEIQDFHACVYGLSWSVISDINYMVTGCEDRLVLMWKPMKDEEEEEEEEKKKGREVSSRVQLHWGFRNGTIAVMGTSIQEDLSQLNKQLLEQRGAIVLPLARRNRGDDPIVLAVTLSVTTYERLENIGGTLLSRGIWGRMSLAWITEHPKCSATQEMDINGCSNDWRLYAKLSNG